MKKSVIYIIAVLMLLASCGAFTYQSVAFNQTRQNKEQQHIKEKELTDSLENQRQENSEMKKKIDNFVRPKQLTDEEMQLKRQAEDWKKRTEELRGYVK